MNSTNSQLILSLSLCDDATFSNYFVGDNAELVNVLKEASSGKGESFVYIWGAKGVGRSHLLQACCHQMNENQSAVYIDLNEYEKFSVKILEGLDHIDLICLDNINSVLNRNDWEEALFCFYNLVREQKKNLIVSGNTLPSQLLCNLKDLQSRLSSGLTFQVKPLNDEQKQSALCMRAQNRGLILPESAAQYLLHHMSRDFSKLIKMLDRLEKASLVEQRRITIPFIKAVLGS